VTDDVYLLAWIASARTAVPRNDGGADVFRKRLVLVRHCELAKQSSSLEVMFIFELFRVIVLPINIRCIICYRVLL